MSKAAGILLVEDETIVAMDIAATLRRLGYEVLGMVDTGRGAIDAALARKPDLILMDIRLKGQMDGIDAAAAIEEESHTPIIFLTAHADEETVKRAKLSSPYGYLVKPFDERTLHRAVDIALQRASTDRGAREDALDALWQSEERFRLLVDAVKDYALFMVDLQGRIATWNPGAERMTGFSPEEVLGKSLTTLRPPDGRHEELASLLDRVRREGGAEWDDAGMRKDGTRYRPHVYCTPLTDRNGDLLGYVSITRDVTEQRRLEAQIAEAQRFEALGQLAGGVAHDFNNMLMVIFARCDLLLREADTVKQRRYVSDIRAAATKNRELTQQLLAAARRQVLERHIVNLNEMILSTMQLLTPTLGEHIAIRTELDPTPWNVDADPNKMHRVLVNLAINARDAMANGGLLTIESRNVHVDAGYARQHINLREGDYVALIVSDTGGGIPAGIRDRIYDPFFTTKDASKGTGLGLAVVRGIVEQSGGHVWMYTEEGRGTTFKIFLPRYTADVIPQPAADEEAPPRGDETVLLVEDDELLRTVVREAMEEQGYRVLEARSPAEALTISSRHHNVIPLLLTDVIMPGMNGRALAEQIVAARPATRVIFMSGYTSHTVSNHAALPPSVRYLEKPISPSVLLRTMRAVLDES